MCDVSANVYMAFARRICYVLLYASDQNNTAYKRIQSAVDKKSTP